MQHSKPQNHKLLQYWLEWENGDATPGDVLKNLKIAGMREHLESLEGQND